MLPARGWQGASQPPSPSPSTKFSAALAHKDPPPQTPASQTGEPQQRAAREPCTGLALVPTGAGAWFPLVLERLARGCPLPCECPLPPLGPVSRSSFGAEGGPGLSRLVPTPGNTFPQRPRGPASRGRAQPLAPLSWERCGVGAGMGRGPQPPVLDAVKTETGSFRYEAGRGPGGQVNTADRFPDPLEGSAPDAGLGGPSPSLSGIIPFSQGREGPLHPGTPDRTSLGAWEADGLPQFPHL